MNFWWGGILKILYVYNYREVKYLIERYIFSSGSFRIENIMNYS